MVSGSANRGDADWWDEDGVEGRRGGRVGRGGNDGMGRGRDNRSDGLSINNTNFREITR